jgi:predicted metal-dependent peptidase
MIILDREIDEQIAFHKKGVNLARIKLRVLRHFPSLKGIMESTGTVDTDVDIATTDGTNIMLNADRVRGEPEAEQAAIYAHELKHIERGDTARPMSALLNIAADAVINEELADGGLPTRIGRVKIPNAVALGADKICAILTKMSANIDGQNFTRRDFNAAIRGDTNAWNKGLQIIAQKENRERQNGRETA